MWGYGMLSLKDLPRAMNDREEWWEKGQGYPCYQRNMMMMMKEKLAEISVLNAKQTILKNNNKCFIHYSLLFW